MYNGKHLVSNFESLLESGCVDWDKFYENHILDELFIGIYMDRLPMDIICEHQKLSEHFLITNFRKFKDWKLIIRTQELSESFIEIFNEERLKYPTEYETFWNEMCANQKLSLDFIENHQDDVSWEEISKHHKITDEEFIERHIDDIRWAYVKDNIKISRETLIKGYTKMMPSIFRYQNFSTEFVLSLPKDVFNHFFNVYTHDCDASIIEKEVYDAWLNLLIYQDMGCDFFEKYWSYISVRDDFLRALVRFNNLLKSFIERHWNVLCGFSDLSLHQKFSIGFFDKHRDYFVNTNNNIINLGWDSFGDGVSSRFPSEIPIKF